MTTMVDIYKALRAVGIDEPAAEAIAQTVEARTQLASKADLEAWRLDLRRELSELKADLSWRMIGAMAILTGIFSAIVTLT